MITFVIFTYNEAGRIERVIENFRRYGTVLLADNNSTDGTIEIAKNYDCDVFIRKEEYEFVEDQRLVDQLYDVINTEWIYWGFADEMLESETLKKILEIISAGQHDIISMDRKNYFYGRFCHNLYHARTNKIFKKHAINFVGNHIHGMGKATVPSSRIYKLPSHLFIHHFISNTASSYLNVINRYTNSELSFKHKVSSSWLGFLLIFFRISVSDLFKSKGYKEGFSGLALTQLMIFYRLVKNIKHYEQINSLTTPSIEQFNNIHRDRLLTEIQSKTVGVSR